MMQNKSMKSSSPSFARGGGSKMAGKQSVGTQKPGQTAQMGSGGGKFASGGKAKMAGKQKASPAKAC
jgi:hypothetical protein